MSWKSGAHRNVYKEGELVRKEPQDRMGESHSRIEYEKWKDASNDLRKRLAPVEQYESGVIWMKRYDLLDDLDTVDIQEIYRMFMDIEEAGYSAQYVHGGDIGVTEENEYILVDYGSLPKKDDTD